MIVDGYLNGPGGGYGQNGFQVAWGVNFR